MLDTEGLFGFVNKAILARTLWSKNWNHNYTASALIRNCLAYAADPNQPMGFPQECLAMDKELGELGSHRRIWVRTAEFENEVMLF